MYHKVQSSLCDGDALRVSVPCIKLLSLSRAMNSSLKGRNVWGGQAELKSLSEALSSVNSIPSSTHFFHSPQTYVHTTSLEALVLRV